mgnify:CR=1 FL=1
MLQTNPYDAFQTGLGKGLAAMAFDGITIASIVKELNQNLTGGRIYKIAQPESDELLLTIKRKRFYLRNPVMFCPRGKAGPACPVSAG